MPAVHKSTDVATSGVVVLYSVHEIAFKTLLLWYREYNTLFSKGALGEGVC